MNITTADIERAASDERWNGWGYLGERAMQNNTLQVAAADAKIVEVANERGWDYEALFTFLNSRYGRYAGDTLFGGGRPEHLQDTLRAYTEAL